jgi:monoamine oxidase
VPVELGAEFVHGRPREIWEHIASNRLTASELKGEQCYFENGELKPVDDGPTTDVLRRMRDYTHPDRTFAEYLAEDCRNIPEEDKEWAAAHVEGFNAARKEEISVRSLVLTEEAAEQAGGDNLYRINGGYDGVSRSLWSGCDGAELRLESSVRCIRWQRRSVTAVCDAASFQGESAIVTLPLGVLQAREGESGYVRFDPDPESIRGVANRLRMGEVIRITFEFCQRFWDWGAPTHKGRLPDLAILFSLDPAFPTWWTSEPFKVPVLTGWASGSKAARLLAMPPAQAIREAIESLGRLFGVPPEQIEKNVVAAYTHNWQSDPFARGAYSYIPAGCVEDVSTFAWPVDDTLFFAGEATHNGGRNGTVDGAIATGRRAAEQVIESFRQR